MMLIKIITRRGEAPSVLPSRWIYHRSIYIFELDNIIEQYNNVKINWNILDILK